MTFTNENMIVLKTSPSPLQPIYANEYEGQWVNYELGDRVDRKLYKPKNNFFRQGGRAIVLGNGSSRMNFPLKRFNISNNHKSLANYNILYGCNMAYTDEGELDYLAVTHRLLATKIPKSLHKNTYAHPETQRTSPSMEMFPGNDRFDAGSHATMLACFHGADKVFLFGFSGCIDGKYDNIYAGAEYYDVAGSPLDDQKWQDNLSIIIRAYPKVKFYRVNSNPPSARKLSVFPNYSIITFNEFVSIADI